MKGPPFVLTEHPADEGHAVLERAHATSMRATGFAGNGTMYCLYKMAFRDVEFPVL